MNGPEPAASGGERVLWGLDIGGTKIVLAVGTADGSVLARDRIPTDHSRSPEEVLSAGLARLAEMHARAGLAGRWPHALGAAVPGPLSYTERKFLEPPNMPRWHHFPIGAFLDGSCGCPAAFMNDANAAALAEWLWGAARGAGTAVFLTMSTGMGAGLIVNGRLYEGPLGLAGEIGHVRLREDGPVGFGKRGSVEGFLSGPGMLQVAAAEAAVCVQRGEPSGLIDMFCAGPTDQAGPAGVERLCALAASGDAAARRVTDRCAAELGRLLAILTDILNPEVFVMGTIGSAHPELFEPVARRVLEDEAIGAAARLVRIVPSGLASRAEQQALAVAWSIGTPR
ncbi:MAG: ROK family protein [Phycisphaerae bacterium]|nr:ROK family protein [Phycisphaerae bacterium]